MSGVRADDKVLALLVSDLHFSLKPPVARSAEEDWMNAQFRPAFQLFKLASKHKCPTICGGDVFDKWNSPPELINLVSGWLPQPFYSISGNHDQAYHSRDNLYKTAYWNLVLSQFVRDVNGSVSIDGLTIHGFPYGVEITPCPERHVLDNSIHLAVVHTYVYGKKAYHGVTKDQHISAYREKLKGYDAVLFGDNHVTVFSNKKGQHLLNPGAFQKRKADEIDHRPCVGLLHEDGSITLEYLDCSQDRFLDGLDVVSQAEKDSGLDLTGFLEELTGLADSDLNFSEAVLRFMESHDKVNESTRKILLNAIGKGER